LVRVPEKVVSDLMSHHGISMLLSELAETLEQQKCMVPETSCIDDVKLNYSNPHFVQVEIGRLAGPDKRLDKSHVIRVRGIKRTQARSLRRVEEQLHNATGAELSPYVGGSINHQHNDENDVK
jgi:hypothetical protein